MICYGQSHYVKMEKQKLYDGKKKGKTCVECGRVLPLEMFYKTGGVWYLNKCKDCYNKRKKAKAVECNG